MFLSFWNVWPADVDFGCWLLLEIGYILADGQRGWTASFPWGGNSRLHGRWTGILEGFVVLKMSEYIRIGCPRIARPFSLSKLFFLLIVFCVTCCACLVSLMMRNGLGWISRVRLLMRSFRPWRGPILWLSTIDHTDHSTRRWLVYRHLTYCVWLLPIRLTRGGWLSNQLSNFPLPARMSVSLWLFLFRLLLRSWISPCQSMNHYLIPKEEAAQSKSIRSNNQKSKPAAREIKVNNSNGKGSFAMSDRRHFGSTAQFCSVISSPNVNRLENQHLLDWSRLFIWILFVYRANTLEI